MMDIQLPCCGHSSLISDYVACALSVSAAEEFEAHVEHCIACSQLLMAAVDNMQGPEWISLARDFTELSAADRTISNRPDAADAISADHTGGDLAATSVSAQTAPANVRYSWVRRIGSGGMGDVWEGWDHLMERSVALKRLGVRRADFNGVQRLMLEALALARLSHPSIITVYEVVTEQSQPVLVMEYVRGMTLSQWHLGRPLPAADAAEICLAIAKALHHAHQNGVIHRDVKPSNVLLRTEEHGALPRREDGSLDLQLSDFGLARIIHDPELTQTGQVIGTPTYMAPEQIIEGQTVDPRSDVFSLGVVLYELLTGRPPFAASETVVVLEMIRTRDPIPPRVLQPHLARDIDTICLKCLRREPNQRYQSADELAEDLVAFLQQRPVRARPVSQFQMAARWAARNRALATLATLAAVAVTFALVAEMRAADSARRQAELERQSGQQTQRLLRDAISIVESYVRLIGEPHDSNRDVTAALRTASTRQALDVYRNYIAAIEKRDVLNWDDLDIVCRFLALQRYSDHQDMTVECLSWVKKSLLHHRRDPVNPEQLVEFVDVQHQFFSKAESPQEIQARLVAEWLEYAQILLSQATVASTPAPRVQALLRGRRACFIRAVIALQITPIGTHTLTNLRAIADAASANAAEIQSVDRRTRMSSIPATRLKTTAGDSTFTETALVEDPAAEATTTVARILIAATEQANPERDRIDTTALMNLLREVPAGGLQSGEQTASSEQ